MSFAVVVEKFSSRSFLFCLPRHIVFYSTSLLKKFNIDVVVPKVKFSLRAIHAMGLDSEDLSSIDKVTAKCDDCSVPLRYLPGEYCFLKFFLTYDTYCAFWVL